MTKRSLIPILILFLLGQARMVVGYDDEVSHPDLTEKAVLKSKLTTYFSQNMGVDFARNHETVISGKPVIEWIKHGSKVEDDQVNRIPCRNSNHFHNPLKLDWNEAGLTEIYDTFCSGWLIPGSQRAYSALVWATSLQAPPPGGAKQTFNEPYAPNSWANARKYYEQALTAGTMTERETNFAETFKALGQTLHLLQDMAVPAHTRNDFNKSHLNQKENKNPYEHYVSENGDLVKNALPVGPNFSNTRLTDFWDANLTPDVVSEPSLQDKAGLSEYTNANFLSEGTLFLNKNNPFVYPNEAGSVKINCIIADPIFASEHSIECIPSVDPLPIGKMRRTYWLNAANWEAGLLLAGENYLDIYYTDPIGKPDITIPPLDDYVHRDYANRLIPRAVGYSAALLDYFFRGRINLLSTGDANRYVITNDSNEDMSGAFSVHYDSKTDGQRHQLTSLTGSVPAHGQSAVLQFAHPTDAQDPGKYMLAFRGTMGNEADAVAGRAVVVPPCPKGVPIIIAGPGMPLDGDQYTATGGVEPYAWSIDKGSITQSGIITVAEECGTALITVKDACGNTGGSLVTLGFEKWVVTDFEKAVFTAAPLNGQPAGCFSCYSSFMCTVDIGTTKTVYYAAAVADAEGYPVCSSSLGSPPCDPPVNYDRCKWLTIERVTSEWKCQHRDDLLQNNEGL